MAGSKVCFVLWVLVLACAAAEAPASSPAPSAAPGLTPSGGGVLGYVSDMMHYLAEVASGLAAATNDTGSLIPESSPDRVVVPGEVPRQLVRFKYTVDELLHAHFDRKVSNDIDIDPCKGGKFHRTLTTTVKKKNVKLT